MNINEFRCLVREETRRLVGESTVSMDPRYDPHDISNTQGIFAPGMKLMRSPGAPFGGNMSAYANVILSNEAAAALRKWFTLAKAAWKKYGEPQEWPNNVVHAAEKLGADFEKLTGGRAPSNMDAAGEML